MLGYATIPLSEVADDPTGERQVLRPWAQTFKGQKTFSGMSVASDPAQADDSLMNMTDMQTLIADGAPVTVTQGLTLTDADITRRSVSLAGAPIAGTPVTLTLEGAGACVVGEDIDLTGASISWAGNAALCALLEAGDTIYVRWTMLKTG